MPGIFDLFDEPAGTEPTALEQAWRDIMADRQATAAGTPADSGAAGDPATPPAPPVGDATGPAQPVGAGPDSGGQVPAPPAYTPPPPPADPFAAMSAEERAELLLLHQAYRDPERAPAVRQALLGVPAPAAATAPPPPPEPTLPEHFQEGTPEAELWHQNRALERRIDELSRVQESSVEDQRRERWLAAAKDAGNAFAERYAGRLSIQEMHAIAQIAGRNKLAQALEMSNGGDVRKACDDALEFVLRQTPGLLARVLGAPVGPGAADAGAGVVPGGAPSPAPPGAPPLFPGTAPALDPAQAAALLNEQRRRTLTALSTGASPVGEAPQRTPLETRGSTGRLTESSRRSIVDQLAASLKTEG